MTLMLLDSASLWYRAYYGMPDTLTAPDGRPVNAIRGYVDMTARLLSVYKPNRLVACLDGDWRPSWRVELFPDYKANRLEEEGDEEEEPETLTPQIPILLDLLDLFGIPVVGVNNFEDSRFKLFRDCRNIEIFFKWLTTSETSKSSI